MGQFAAVAAGRSEAEEGEGRCHDDEGGVRADADGHVSGTLAASAVACVTGVAAAGSCCMGCTRMATVVWNCLAKVGLEGRAAGDWELQQRHLPQSLHHV